MFVKFEANVASIKKLAKKYFLPKWRDYYLELEAWICDYRIAYYYLSQLLGKYQNLFLGV